MPKTRGTVKDKEPKPLTAPFPYFGGKSKIAPEVWQRFGNPDNYVEPFGGSLAVLLARPVEHKWWLKKETVGDYSGLVVNFFRAVAKNPTATAEAASWPVTEADLTARHLYLVRYQDELAEKLAADPKYYDVEAAGWWVWGISCWVGGDWMSGVGPWRPGDPDKTGPGVFRKMPMVAGSHGGKGIHKPLTDIEFDGVNLPSLGEEYRESLDSVFKALSDRLRRVRITCGSWSRLTKAAVDPGKGKIAAVFLDPPYDLSLRRGDLYGASDRSESGEVAQVHARAREWALEAGVRPELRIAYCSYSTPEEDTLFEEAGWTAYRWQAKGGYGLQSHNSARSNREKEVVWFSPHCLQKGDSVAL